MWLFIGVCFSPSVSCWRGFRVPLQSSKRRYDAITERLSPPIHLCGCLGGELVILPGRASVWGDAGLRVPRGGDGCWVFLGLLRVPCACTRRVSCHLPFFADAWKSHPEPATLPPVQPNGVLNGRQFVLTVSHSPPSREYCSLLAELLLCCAVRAVYGSSAPECNWWPGNKMIFHVWKFSVILRTQLGKLM